MMILEESSERAGLEEGRNGVSRKSYGACLSLRRIYSARFGARSHT